ncbi:glycosyltransferase family 4 protein [Sedimentisphaera salicampi]|uniref:Putative glycosyl transferase n=1 Tax=Sedimentisphaera salicampi TaxID=1941349 RepID=A0A1W6LKK9_9BACT|nr:glycosyltransferase family 4 protein [Sedimentisphaera salicampi]ARN56282.1 putative glycosyl transferase [Sedimentisphaera salicampi]
MKILFITHYFYPDPNIFYGLPFAKELVKRGHQVEVLTSFPNYLDGERFGYKQKVLLKETIDGVKIFRVPLYPSHNESSVKRSLCYLTYAMSASIWGVWNVSKPDVVYLPHGPITSAFPGIFTRIFRGAPYVLNIQDIWPDSVESTGMLSNRFALNLLNSICKMAYSFADNIAVISPGAKNKLIERGVEPEKIELVYNWCDEVHFPSDTAYDFDLAEKLNVRGCFNVVYTGNLGPAQDMMTVLRAAEKIQSIVPEVRFILVGSGVEQSMLQKELELRNINNVILHDRVSLNHISNFLSLANLALVHLKDKPLFRITMPSKIQTYMSSGKAILAGISGDPSKLVADAGAGIGFEPGDSESLCKAVYEARSLGKNKLAEMGRNARAFYEQNMSFSHGVDTYLKIFEQIRRK